MSASPSHILKYVHGHQSTFPYSPILVILTTPLDILIQRKTTLHRLVHPAIVRILSTTPLSDDPALGIRPNLLLHVFSNGGSYQLGNLFGAYHATTSVPFPAHVTIFDSCPGRATFTLTVRALSSALPLTQFLRFLLLLLIYTLYSWYWIATVPWGKLDPIEVIRQAINTKAFMGRELRQYYMCSIISWEHVESHAIEAVKNGFNVRQEIFPGSGHCAHARGDALKIYWRIVDEMWQGDTQISVP